MSAFDSVVAGRIRGGLVEATQLTVGGAAVTAGSGFTTVASEAAQGVLAATAAEGALIFRSDIREWRMFTSAGGFQRSPQQSYAQVSNTAGIAALANSATGRVAWDSQKKALMVFDGAAWVRAVGTASAAVADVAITSAAAAGAAPTKTEFDAAVADVAALRTALNAALAALRAHEILA